MLFYDVEHVIATCVLAWHFLFPIFDTLSFFTMTILFIFYLCLFCLHVYTLQLSSLARCYIYLWLSSMTFCTYLSMDSFTDLRWLTSNCRSNIMLKNKIFLTTFYRSKKYSHDPPISSSPQIAKFVFTSFSFSPSTSARFSAGNCHLVAVVLRPSNFLNWSMLNSQHFWRWC